MLKIYYILLLSVATPNLYGQDSVSKYKAIADKIIEQHFDAAQLKNIKCEAFKTSSKNNSESFYPSYDMFDHVTESFSNIEFTYSFFSNKIGDKIDFYITLNKNKHIENEKEIFKHIPDCFLNDNECGFIKKDSAVKLALEDKIEFPQNLEIQFIKQKKTDKYCWVIDSYPEIDLNSKRGSIKFIANQRRVIDALTGKTLPSQQFD